MKVVREEVYGDDGCFKCVKITLLVIHIFGFVGATIMFFVCMGLLISGVHNDKLDPKEQEHIRNIAIFGSLLFGFAIIYEMIAIAGIAKQNKTIVMSYLVLGIIGFVGNIIYGYQTGLLSLFVLWLTGYYAYMIVKKDRQLV